MNEKEVSQAEDKEQLIISCNVANSNAHEILNSLISGGGYITKNVDRIIDLSWEIAVKMEKKRINMFKLDSRGNTKVSILLKEDF